MKYFCSPAIIQRRFTNSAQVINAARRGACRPRPISQHGAINSTNHKELSSRVVKTAWLTGKTEMIIVLL